MCKYIEGCSFFKEFSRRESLIWKAMIKNYCDDGRGCTRHSTYERDGLKNLSSEILPSGTRASNAMLSLP